MTPPLLTTKFYQPQPQKKTVTRNRLIERLNTGISNKLTLISAPAGFGKSTALSTWIERSKKSIAWLSLDEGDAELTRFLAYFIAALQTTDSSLGRGAAVALQSPDGVKTDILLTNLLNEITEARQQVILILDDYHVIESQPVDAALTFIIDNLPREMHLVISSRIDPSFPLSRLRANSQMTELRVDDLRFTPIETEIFLNQVMDLGLSSRNVEKLEARTEGWIAGLQLAALSIQGLERQAQVSDFIARFAGSDRYIQDYLTDEVLKQQPEETKDFLLKTSILDQLNGSLCDALTLQTNGQAVLENLESGNLFITPLDNKRLWYRYHHLFADLLTHNLSFTFPDLIPELHQRASSWYENNGFLDKAILHAKSGGAKDKVAIIVEKYWQEYIHRGELVKLRALLEYLKPEYTKTSAPLSMAYCWINVMTRTFKPLPGYVEDVRAAYEPVAENGVLPQPNKLAVIPSLLETIDAIISLDSGQPEKAESHALKAISIVPDDLDLVICELLQGAAGYWLAQAYRSLGKLEQACDVLIDVLELMQSSKNYYGAANTISLIASMYQEMGKTNQAISLCQDAIRFNKENHWEEFPPSGLVNIVYADLLIDVGDYQAAQENLEKGRALVESINSIPIKDLVSSVETKVGNTTQLPKEFEIPLTSREVEVLILVAKGHSNREISERLFLSLDTVKGHNRKIYAKLGVKNRTQAVNKATALNIIPQQRI